MRVLAISSQVACGAVGLSAALPVLHLLGCETIALPTILLSNHPLHRHTAGAGILPEDLRAMLDALDGNGWLATVDVALTGYLPSAEHAAFAAEALSRVRDRTATRGKSARLIVDPVLGDDPGGLYIDAAAAEAVRDRLVPMADLILPNRFELGWLSGRRIETAADAVAAARALPPTEVFAKSVPLEDGLANMLVSAAGAALCRFEVMSGAPKGTGDALSALVASGLGLGAATGRLQALIEASLGSDRLAIATASAQWLGAAALPEEDFGAE